MWTIFLVSSTRLAAMIVFAFIVKCASTRTTASIVTHSGQASLRVEVCISYFSLGGQDDDGAKPNFPLVSTRPIPNSACF